MTARVGPARGWYVDPWNAFQDRRWDGSQWTARTRPGRSPQAQVLNGVVASIMLGGLLTPVVSVGLLLGGKSMTAAVLGRAASWAVVNLLVVVWLGRRYARRPFGFQSEPALGTLLPIMLVAATASDVQARLPAWAAAAWLVAILPVPVWAALRRRRFARWAPLDRCSSAAMLVILFGMLALFLPISAGPAHALAFTLPLLLVHGAAWLRTPPAPSFTVVDRAQPWWPRTPGWYRDTSWGIRRWWDGSRWWDDPQRDRRIRRMVARFWTGVMIAITPLMAESTTLVDRVNSAWQLPDMPPALDPWIAGGDAVLVWAILIAVTAAGTVTAWASVGKPLPPDASFPPANRPAEIAPPLWATNPDDPSTWRYWDGRTWTPWTAPKEPGSHGAAAAASR